MSGMTNPSDNQPDSNQPESTPQPDPNQPSYGQTYGEQPANPYGGANYDEKPPAPAYGTPPPPPAYGAQPYGSQPYGAPAAYGGAVGQPDSGATTAMVLGIVGLVGGFICGIAIFLSPVAMFLGMSAKKRIDASAGALTGRGNAQTGFILGIIGTVLLVLAIIVIIGVVVIGISSGGFDDPSSSYEPYDSEF